MLKTKLVTTVMLTILALGSGVALYAGYATAQDDSHGDHHAGGMEMQAANSTGDPYPLSTCPVTGEKLGGMGDPVIYDHDGREIRFCCGGCIGKFKANPDKYLKDVNAQIVKEQQGSYPLDTCLVSGEKLGGMGKVVNYVLNNRLTQLCCGGCIKKIKADPAAYIAKLDAAVIKDQLPKYPLETCVVTGKKLESMGDPINHVFANQLVRFCSKGCIPKFEADPGKFMAKLN